MTIAQLVDKFKKELLSYYSPNEVWTFIDLIFKKMFSIDKTFIHAHPEQELPKFDYEQIRSIIKELKQYKPIQYIIGEVQFLDLTLSIKPGVFIPRPETEELVNLIIQHKHSIKHQFKLIDIGTGSGCIAVSLAKHLPLAQVFATDLSTTALDVAKLNAQRHNVNIFFQLHDIIATYPPVFNGKTPKFNVIVSNPPYVPVSMKQNMSKTVLDYEPEEAIFVSDDEPLIYYEALCYFADKYLEPNGDIYCEVNEFLVKEMVEMLNSRGYNNFSIINDLSGKSRIFHVKAKNNN